MSVQQIRYIHTDVSQGEIADLLQTIFASELLMPSRKFWLVSPWISDIPILDNRSNAFSTFEPKWGSRKVTISEVLAKMVEMGTEATVVTRPDPKNQYFLNKLAERVGHVHPRLKLLTSAMLHAKALLGDGYILSGSMNFTFHGIYVWEEQLQYVTDQTLVAENRAVFFKKWRGELSWT